MPIKVIEDDVYEEYARDEQEEKEECYHTWDEANYNGFSQSDFV